MAQISVGLLIVIVIRSLGEVLRLHHALGHRLPPAQAGPYVSLAAAVAALAVVTLHFLHSASAQRPGARAGG